jgi:formyl-CoA transferase
VADPKFATNADRVRQFDETNALVQSFMLKKPTDTWITALRQAGVPVAPIHTLDQALSNDHVLARGVVSTTHHPTVGEVKHISHPVTFNRQLRQSQRPAPTLGQHTHEVLQEAGFSADEVARLAADGVIG